MITKSFADYETPCICQLEVLTHAVFVSCMCRQHTDALLAGTTVHDMKLLKFNISVVSMCNCTV